MKRLVIAILLLVSLFARAQEIRRPSTDIDTGFSCVNAANTQDAAPPMPNAYDASGLSTSSSESASGASTNLHAVERQFSGFPAASGAYNALTLNINFSCTDSLNFEGLCRITYSTTGVNGTYSIAFTSSSGVNVAEQTTTITLSAGQDLTQIAVRACGEDSSVSATVATETVTVWDIWTSGTLSVTPPAAPTGLSLAAAANGLSVQLTWTDNATNETSYQINKCSGTSCTPVSYQTGLATNLASFNDTSGVSPGTVYGYQSCAVNSAGTSCSATSYVTTPSAPAAPTGLALSISNTSITITWTDNATNETNYILQRCSGSGCTPADYQTLGANTVSFIDTSIPGRTLFIYNVLASNAVGRSSGTGNSSLISPARQPGQSSHHAGH